MQTANSTRPSGPAAHPARQQRSHAAASDTQSPELRKAKDSLVDRYPAKMLELFCAILPDQVTSWPYGIEAVIDRLAEADAKLKKDERWVSLKRRWDSR